MSDIIFICNANMCRSAMAEGILKKRLIDNGLLQIKVASMGIHAQEGNCATDYAVEVCRDHQLDIGEHRSRPLVPEELKHSRMILAMEPVQVDFINIFFPQVADRLFMLGAWPEQKSKKATVDDPVGKSLRAYRKTFLQLEKLIENLLPELVERYHR